MTDLALLAAELRAVADDVAATLAPTDPLDRVLPGTATHATLLAARATALAGLAALTRDTPDPRRARPISPRECHGNDAFCSTCWPRNTLRPTTFD